MNYHKNQTDGVGNQGQLHSFTSILDLQPSDKVAALGLSLEADW